MREQGVQEGGATLAAAGVEADVRVATPPEERAVDEALGLETVVVRLPKAVAADLAALATLRGVSVQACLQQVLEREMSRVQRFAVGADVWSASDIVHPG